MAMGSTEGCPNHANYVRPSRSIFQQCAESPLLCNRDLGALAVTVLPIPFARRPTATACASGSAHLDGAGRVSV